MRGLEDWRNTPNSNTNTSIQMHKYTNTQLHKYTNTEIHIQRKEFQFAWAGGLDGGLITELPPKITQIRGVLVTESLVQKGKIHFDRDLEKESSGFKVIAICVNNVKKQKKPLIDLIVGENT